MRLLDKLLNTLTMYRLVVYVLALLASLAVVFSFMGRVSASPTALIISLSLLVVSAYGSDRGFGRYFDVATNMESSLITALILFFILDPVRSPAGAFTLVLAGTVSSASKFILARNGKHIFNPAALAAGLLSLTGLHAVTWWIGSSVLWPFALVLGLSVVWKIRRLPLLISFTSVAVVGQFMLLQYSNQPIGIGMKHALLASPLIFLATIMLTEPATMPPRRNLQIVFAALVAVLYVTAPSFGPFIVYPEIALLIGNVFAYTVSPKFRVRLQLREIQKISDRVYNYVFQPDRPLAFLPGQYMEWTLADVPYDSRGNRRTFTIASSPTESEVQLGLKYFEPASTYKAAFYGLQPGDSIYASQLAGDFTIRGHETDNLAFIAGGIGITPFRSMIKYVSDHGMNADITLLYVVRDPDEFAYFDVFREASKFGIKTIPIVTDMQLQSDKYVTAKLSSELIKRYVPDYTERTFYISGPNVLVDATKDYLQSLQVTNRRIKTDHFSGY
jgi:ferredoxin-NADP reductase/Na+-translocating ferredoxin:NAD+ oxidoreductase RnfD subunit